MQTALSIYWDKEIRLIGEFLYEAEVTVNRPTLILFSAFEGISTFSRDYARRLVQVGYQVFLADMYGEQEEAKTLERCFELVQPFLEDRALVRRRAELALAQCRQLPGVCSTKIGALGFCFGGTAVLELARSGADFVAGAVFHGNLAQSALPTFSIKPALLIQNGYADPMVSPNQLHDFAREMTEMSEVDWTYICFGQAQHSFTDPATGHFNPLKEVQIGRVYNPLAAEASYQHALYFFQRLLNTHDTI